MIRRCNFSADCHLLSSLPDSYHIYISKAICTHGYIRWYVLDSLHTWCMLCKWVEWIFIHQYAWPSQTPCLLRAVATI